MTVRRSLRLFLDLPLRLKFILSFLIVICLGGLVTLIFGTRLEHRTILDLAQAKVRHDLASAWMVYNDRLKDIKDIVLLNSIRESILTSASRHESQQLKKSLSRVHRSFGLDILTITDDRGVVIFRSTNPDAAGDDLSADPLIRRALEGETVAASQIISRQELIKEGQELADRAFLRFVPTPKAAARQEDFEDSGMMLKAAAPLIDDSGRRIGVIVGGILLNRNYEIVDRVKEIVFKGEKYKGVDIGTATIFQHDLRISTNVQNIQGERAIGTRVSKEVNQAVLREGKPWLDRAFVVNDWYIAAYEPIKNIDGEIIGILYVGMLEKPYIDLRNSVMRTFTGMAVVFMGILLVILYFITSSITNPLKSMVVATNKIASGDLSHRVGSEHADEIGQLARSFNQMTENLNKANKKLVDWGRILEKRVAERTKELKEVQDSLIQSEKLASLGKIAAGVAHEINNPLTSILLNTHLMLEKLKEDDSFFESLTLIADETARCSNIVKGLLEFSRQNPPQKEYAALNDIIQRTIQLLENQVAFHNVTIVRKLDPNLPQIMLDKNKIKQVFWNLMINAAEAMKNGGALTISSRLSEDSKHIEAEFEDTGTGIPAESVSQLFDPFFTTKGGGTGLGLAVSYGIIRQHQGRIKVKSQLGRGSAFTVILPIS